MAHGFLQATDLRTERNFLGDIAGAIGNRIGKASNMARRERAYAESIAEKNNTSLAEAGIGRGHFFQRALGSAFGGDAIARTRGRFAKDATMGIDPTGSQASRFRGGFVDRGRYDYSDEIFSAPANSGGGLAGIFSSGPSVAQRLLEAGPTAINPEVLGGEIAKYQGSPTTNAAGFTVDTQATEIKDIAGILNQIGQMIVRTNNNTVQAIDNVQRVNVRVVESVQGLGQLQVGIAERQIQNQRLLASNAENTAEKIASRQLAASEKANMAQQRESSGDLDPVKSGFGGGGGILGNMFGTLGSVLDTGLSLLGGGRRGRRGIAGRMSRAGRAAQRRQGFSTAMDGDVGVRGMNFRDNGMSGNALSRARIRAGTAGPDVLGTAHKDITKRYAQRYGEKAALKRFGAESLEAAGMGIARKSAMAKFLKPVLKRVPLVGGLLDFGVSLALGEPVGRAAAKAIGATLGATLGSFLFPGAGTILGGIAGDIVGGSVYNALQGGSAETGQDRSLTPFAAGGIITKPVAGLVGEAGAEGVFPLEGAKGKETFLKFGEGIIEAQNKNKTKHAQLQASGLKEYYENQGGWRIFGAIMKNPFESLGELLFGPGNPNLNDDDDAASVSGGVPGAGGMLNIGKGGGELQGLTAEDFKWLAYGISGEAGGGDDQYAVAASILNRYATGKYKSIEDIIKAPGQYHAYEIGTLRHMPDVAANFQSAEGQAKLVAALELLQGRESFKGQRALANRVVDEDPMVDPSGNYYHYGWQGSGKNAVAPAGWTPPTAYQKFIKKRNTPDGLGDPEAVRKAIELLGGDPDAEVETPSITGPRSSVPKITPVAAADLLQKSALTEAAAMQLALRPMVASVPTEFQQSGKSDADAFTFGLATAGSSGMGTDVFANLSLKSLS